MIYQVQVSFFAPFLLNTIFSSDLKNKKALKALLPGLKIKKPRTDIEKSVRGIDRLGILYRTDAPKKETSKIKKCVYMTSIHLYVFQTIPVNLLFFCTFLDTH
ncbi:hypothetical protein MTBBW1_1290013 [Desulfamplus magnetovallimortis]|uniref:Uncharacterized protein n=1 Tax=Desulfamplus magnetovallimortis TaxID=1246637 RepID=A0A1W1H6Y1_9BACT|nr:hypothetical protein MTBBW1_1290013 [Desulfamplus magnetovallimortis]